MVIGEAIGSTEVAIIGAGPGGYIAAIKCAQLGKKVTLIDQESVGGVCLHHGCIPTKALIHVAESYHHLSSLKEMGITVSSISFDYRKSLEWRNKIITNLDNGIRGLLKHYKIQLLRAKAFFEESNKLKIQKIDPDIDINALEYRKCIIASGSRERTLPQVEIDGKNIITSYHILQAEQLPESLLVIGGGYIGIEISQLLTKFGKKVIILEAATNILDLLDKDVSDVVRKNLEEGNVAIYTSAQLKECKVVNGQVVTTFLDDNGKQQTMTTEKALVSIGRVPDTSFLQLQNTKIQTDERGYIKVNNQMQTHDPRILAIGDVVGGVMLAHKASYEAKVAAEVIAGKNAALDNFIPYAIFSDPEIAGVGITEKEAKKRNIAYQVKRLSMDSIGKARILGEKGGFFKILYDENQNILGITIAGPRAADMIGEGVLAMEMGTTLEDLSLIIHPHPTVIEGYGELADLALGKPSNSL